MGYRAMQETSFGHAINNHRPERSNKSLKFEFQGARWPANASDLMGLAVVGRRQGVVALLVFTFRWIESKLHMV